MGGHATGVVRRAAALRHALRDLLCQEFDWSAGHLAALLSGCVFAPSILTFWAVNGVLDFSTAFVLGSVGGPGGLALRFLAYLLLVPVFLAVRATYYLVHPTHRETVLSGACPQSDLFSLDWFSVGILATGLPLALQDVGPWIGSNAIYLVGIFLVPQVLSARRLALGVKLVAVALGTALFLYANYGVGVAASVAALPQPAAVLGPVATLDMPAGVTDYLLRVTNSMLTGPVAVAGIAFGMNRLLTHPEVQSIPLLHHSLPRRDPARVVVASAALGTVFYLSVLALLGDTFILFP